MNRYESFRNAYSASDQNILRYAITNIIEETVMNGGSGVAADLSDNRFIGFLSWENNRSDLETEYDCQALGGTDRLPFGPIFESKGICRFLEGRTGAGNPSNKHTRKHTM
ncbi:hypothetical protein ACFSQ7_25715 [Paenibacillus rhizoplanae]